MSSDHTAPLPANIIDANDVIVLLACSGKKRDGKHLLIDLYDGPMWQTLRQHLGAIPRRNVFVLSAKFGFRQAAFSDAEPYDEKLSAAKAQRLIDRGAAAPNDLYGAVKRGRITSPNAITTIARWNHPYRAVIIGGAGLYADVFDAWLPEFIQAGMITADAPVHRVTGGIGQQRSQLGVWLRQHQASSVAQAAE